MAVLYITEYTSLDKFGIPQEPGTDQTVAIGAGSAQSAALANNTQYVVLSTDAVCSVKFAANPTAAATNRRLAANTSTLLKVAPFSGLKIAVITNT